MSLSSKGRVNKSGFSALPLLSLPLDRQPTMWKKKMQMALSESALRQIGVNASPTTKLAEYISGHARDLPGWFVTIDSPISGVSVDAKDVDVVKCCLTDHTLNIHGEAIPLGEITMTIYSM